MLLTQKILDNLNRPFDKEPYPFVALRISYGGDLRWTVADGMLTLTYGDADHAYDLSTYTVGSLAAALSAIPTMAVESLDTSREGLSALVLLDGSATLGEPNADAFLGYTSLNWALLESWATELEALKAAMAAVPDQMSTTTASGIWLDELGAYFGVARNSGEPDALYGQRIIAQTLRPIANNVAMELAIEAYTGQPCTVEDVVIYRGAFPIYDGTIDYDGTHDYNSPGSPNYGLFDVTTAYDLVQGGDISTFTNDVTNIVNQLRAAGTHLRAVALANATPITDALTPPSSTSSTMAVSQTSTDAFTAPADSSSPYAADFTATIEALTAPTETQAGTVYEYLKTTSGVILTDQAGDPIMAEIGPLFA